MHLRPVCMRSPSDEARSLHDGRAASPCWRSVAIFQAKTGASGRGAAELEHAWVACGRREPRLGCTYVQSSSPPQLCTGSKRKKAPIGRTQVACRAAAPCLASPESSQCRTFDEVCWRRECRSNVLAVGPRPPCCPQHTCTLRDLAVQLKCRHSCPATMYSRVASGLPCTCKAEFGFGPAVSDSALSRSSSLSLARRVD